MEQSANTRTPVIAPVSAETDSLQSITHSTWIGWSSFFFAVAQSVCSAFVALNGVRLLISAAAFGSALGVLKIADNFHYSAVRIPMMMLALLGSLFNLAAIWQLRRLRSRPASAWRQKSLSGKKLNAERLQLTLSVLTLVLLGFEYYYHIKIGAG